LATALALTVLPSQAGAQAAQASSDQAAPETPPAERQGVGGQANVSSQRPADTEIVVTGTLIRGAAPVGSNVIAVGPEKAASQGATTNNELLATIPQVSNLFMTPPTQRLGIAANQIQVVRPNLRNLSSETGSSSSTLVLFDGHRIAGVGVTQSAVDPDILPQLAIERVEVVTDGGSSTYGSDAVGGVINFITRKRFDGAKAEVRYGIADDYNTLDADAIIGRDWGSGSLYAAYSYQRNDALFGRDRSFVKAIDWNTGIPIGRQCNPGNVSVRSGVATTSYALPGLTPNTFNACDSTTDSTIVPVAERHAATISLHQELTSALTLDVRAFYGRRESTAYSPLRGDATVTATNAFYRPVGSNPTATQTVSFTLAPVLGNEAATSETAFSEWGTNAELKAQLSEKWEVRALLNYSESSSRYNIVGLNQTLMSAAGSASNPNAAINFYNPAATPNLDVIRALANSETAAEGRDNLFQARAIVDGALFRLPGGDVRLAAGYEYLDDSFTQRVAPPNGVIGAVNNVAWTPYSRNVNSLFGEAQIPVFGEDNRTAGFYSLVLSASVRYDHFSDFGGTTNPKFAATYRPVSWLAVRGNYSTSFNAPGVVDQLGSQRNLISFFPINAFVRPGDVPTVIGTVAVQGSTKGLKPQTANIWSIGTDIDPVFIPGLHASVSYYTVKFNNLITVPTSNPLIFTNFPNNVIANPTGVSTAQLLAFSSLAPNGPSVVGPLIAANRGVYELVNFLQGNYGTLKVRGIDFDVNFHHTTSFGGVDASVSGNYQIERTQQVGPGATPSSAIGLPTDLFSPRMTLQATLGADVGNFRTQLTLNHVSGSDVTPAANLPQDHVGAFDIFNLFFRYRVSGDSMLLKDLAFTLNINNVFDTNPPVYKTAGFGGNGYPQGEFTVGRLFMLGVSKQF
jgi:iron complex outermembrane receptor protein